ncbi:MAG: hypothetical protein PHG48_00795 [Eubacteriales bacterium]|nr:hypothetical protein [Eubacteriales bacterium]
MIVLNLFFSGLVMDTLSDEDMRKRIDYVGNIMDYLFNREFL